MHKHASTGRPTATEARALLPLLHNSVLDPDWPFSNTLLGHQPQIGCVISTAAVSISSGRVTISIAGREKSSVVRGCVPLTSAGKHTAEVHFQFRLSNGGVTQGSAIIVVWSFGFIYCNTGTLSHSKPSYYCVIDDHVVVQYFTAK